MSYRVPIQVAVYPVRFRDDKWEYLLLKRVEDRGGFWQGVTGAPEKKEKILEAAKRELLEETGFYVPPDQLNWAFSYRYPLLINVFWVKLNRQPRVTMPDGEHDKYVWCKLWEIRQPTIPHVPYIVQQVTGNTWNLAPSSL